MQKDKISLGINIIKQNNSKLEKRENLNKKSQGNSIKLNISSSPKKDEILSPKKPVKNLEENSNKQKAKKIEFSKIPQNQFFKAQNSLKNLIPKPKNNFLKPDDIFDFLNIPVVFMINLFDFIFFKSKFIAYIFMYFFGLIIYLFDDSNSFKDINGFEFFAYSFIMFPIFGAFVSFFLSFFIFGLIIAYTVCAFIITIIISILAAIFMAFR